MANFCANCGNKLRKEDNFCVNCGAKIDKSDIKQHNPSLNQYYDSREKNKAKKELKRVVGGRLIYNKNFSNTLAENGLDIVHDREAIIKQVEKEIGSGQIKSAGVEFRVNQLILEYKIKKEQEQIRLSLDDPEPYCLNCGRPVKIGQAKCEC
ncbi:zinc-ribbon domain-containing protein [Methanobrevibacter sp.]|uniref:zinc-ribbon domain-containing protein n=1 Tax=Methanobrevibacter sp. TaxID=66852 RepID=UPI0025E03963|nr:zinc ribbon domain-containing protein [Methanobrevibacter sp.]MBQ6511936.1 zinc-ribbon domain-containing protein [Methanobrevibacter sp.]